MAGTKVPAAIDSFWQQISVREIDQGLGECRIRPGVFESLLFFSTWNSVYNAVKRKAAQR
jgi:hypothetical protein